MRIAITIAAVAASSTLMVPVSAQAEYQWVQSFPTCWRPESIIVSPEKVFVTDYHGGQIQVFDHVGTLLGAIGSPGFGSGQLNGPLGIDLDSSGNIWVADGDNHRVQEFSNDGTFLRSIGGSDGTGNGQFARPWGVNVDPAGNIWVCDWNAHRIQEFDSTGTFLLSFGSYGSQIGQLIRPAGIAFDASGNLLVVESGITGGRVQKFSNTGSPLGVVITGLNYPDRIMLDPSGNIWVNDQNFPFIKQYTSDGTFLQAVGSYGTGNGQFWVKPDFDFDSNNNLWVADLGNNVVQELTSVPEPATLSLLTLGGLAVLRRR